MPSGEGACSHSGPSCCWGRLSPLPPRAYNHRRKWNDVSAHHSKDCNADCALDGRGYDLSIDNYAHHETISDVPLKLTEGGGSFGNERPGDLCYYAPWCACLAGVTKTK
jgi:hypothetical protein